MHIDIDDLALIRAICEHGSVTRAAEALQKFVFVNLFVLL